MENKKLYPYQFTFMVDGKAHQKTIVASDGYDAGHELRRLYPKATNVKLH